MIWTDLIGLSCGAISESAASSPRLRLTWTACALNGAPSEKVTPLRSCRVSVSPLSDQANEVASPGPALPCGSSLISDAYTSDRSLTSLPACEVTGSHSVGGNVAKLSVPLGPPVLAAGAAAVPELPPQAAIISAAPAAIRTARVLRKRHP